MGRGRTEPERNVTWPEGGGGEGELEGGGDEEEEEEVGVRIGTHWKNVFFKGDVKGGCHGV